MTDELASLERTHFIGQLYEVISLMGVGNDSEYISGEFLLPGEFLMFIGEAVNVKFSSVFHSEGRALKFFRLSTRKPVWISTAWLKQECLRFCPCDD